MPRLVEVAKALVGFGGRYEFIDAFADDIDEVRTRTIGEVTRLVRMQPHPLFESRLGGKTFTVELLEEQGIARFRLGANGVAVDPVVNSAALGGIIGAALTAAYGKKEGLLGGLVLGMLVGGLAGAAADRALALQFDPSTGEWRLYSGPLLRWAKRTLIPTTAPAA